jgi:hypothetical protein
MQPQDGFISRRCDENVMNGLASSHSDWGVAGGGDRIEHHRMFP